MNNNIKQLWCDALRSGEWQQGQNALVVYDEDKAISYCCLGVLLEVAKSVGIADTEASGIESLTESQLEWAGLSAKEQAALIKANDSCLVDFNEIADIIESNDIFQKSAEILTLKGLNDDD